MIESIVLGIIQGIAEWLPVSSEGLIVLLSVNFFEQRGLGEILNLALFLHFGTFFAAVLYFRKEVVRLFFSLINYRQSEFRTKRLLRFLLISTLISGGLGFAIYKLVVDFFVLADMSGRIFTVLIGILLMGTAFFQLRTKKDGLREIQDLNFKDAVLIGFVQGLAVLPGFSRSGLTVSTLLLRKFDDQVALRASFLMSIPIVFFGNMFLNFSMFSEITPAGVAALLAAFAFGILTIHALLRIAEKVNFGYFVLGFGVLVIFSALLKSAVVY